MNCVCIDTSKAESKAKGKRTHNLFKVFKKACEWMHAVGKCVPVPCVRMKNTPSCRRRHCYDRRCCN